jgi:hypothetical protein
MWIEHPPAWARGTTVSSDKANRWSMESAPQAYGTGLSFLSRALPLCTHFFNHARTLVSILECSLISGEPVLPPVYEE